MANLEESINVPNGWNELWDEGLEFGLKVNHLWLVASDVFE